MATNTARAGFLAANWWRRFPLPLRYAVAGGVTQVVYLTALGAALATGVHYLIAVLIAQVLAIAYAFPVYRRRVFEAEGALPRQFVTFLSVWGIGAAMSFVGVPLLVELLGLPPFVAQLVVLVGVFSFTFVVHRRLTFGERSVTTQVARSTAGAQ